MKVSGFTWFAVCSGVLGAILISVWTYAGLEKLLRWEHTRISLYNQVFPSFVADVLVYALPVSELAIALLLLSSVTRWWGFLSSIMLLILFTTYVGLIWVGAFPRVPCSCAGLFEQLAWDAHFWLNVLLIVCSVCGLVAESRSRSGGFAIKDR